MSIYGKDSKWDLFIGIMTEPTMFKNQRKFNIYISEIAPFAEENIHAEMFKNKVELENIYNNKKETSEATISKTILADYFGVTSSLDVPTMYKGQQVLVLNYGHSDRWYWLPLERDDHLKTFEHYRIHCNDLAATNKVPTAEPEELEKKQSGITDDNSYFFEIDTKYKKMIRFRTANTDGEDFRYFFEVDAEAHTVKLWDVPSNKGERPKDTPNQIVLESRQVDPPDGLKPHGKITLQTSDGFYICMNNVDMNIMVPRDLTMHVGRNIMTEVNGFVSHEVDGPVELNYHSHLQLHVDGDAAIAVIGRVGLHIFESAESIIDKAFLSIIGQSANSVVNGPVGHFYNFAETKAPGYVQVIAGIAQELYTCSNAPVAYTKCVAGVTNEVHSMAYTISGGTPYVFRFPALNLFVGGISLSAYNGMGPITPPPATPEPGSAFAVSTEPPPAEGDTAMTETGYDSTAGATPASDGFIEPDPVPKRMMMSMKGPMLKGDAKGDSKVTTDPTARASDENFPSIPPESDCVIVTLNAPITTKGNQRVRITETLSALVTGTKYVTIEGQEFTKILGDSVTDADGKYILNVGSDGLYELNVEGTATFNYVNGYTENVDTEVYQNYASPVTITADSNFNVVANGEFTFTTAGPTTVDLQGTTTFASADTLDIEANGPITVRANDTLDMTAGETTLTFESLILTATNSFKLITELADIAATKIIDSVEGILHYLEELSEDEERCPFSAAGGIGEEEDPEEPGDENGEDGNGEEGNDPDNSEDPGRSGNSNQR